METYANATGDKWITSYTPEEYARYQEICKRLKKIINDACVLFGGDLDDLERLDSLITAWWDGHAEESDE